MSFHVEPEAGKTFNDRFAVVAVLQHEGKRLIVGKWTHISSYTVMEEAGWCARVCGCKRKPKRFKGR